MPGMKMVGTKTAERIRAMAMTGPETSSIALSGRVVRRQALLDVVLDRLDHDDGVIHDQADGQHQAKERERIDRKAEHREERERADERDRHGDERNQRGAPALQEDEDDEATRISASTSVFSISCMPAVTASVVSSAMSHSPCRAEKRLLSFGHQLLRAGGRGSALVPGSW
jgi:hypothetical protein